LLAVLFGTMRRRNGYASLYDLVTRTRVVAERSIETAEPVCETLALPAEANARGADGEFEQRESSHFVLHQDVAIDQSGGFGCFLQMAHNWADFPQTQRSYELIARYVMPRFNGDNEGRMDSMQWASANRTELMDAGRQAKVAAAQKYAAERERTSGTA